METFDKVLAIKAQSDLCKEKKYPHFAPFDGECYDCRRIIYEPQEREAMGKKWVTGITVESASISLVTSCPHCQHSYCD